MRATTERSTTSRMLSPWPAVKCSHGSHTTTVRRPDHIARLAAKIREGNTRAFPEVRAQHFDQHGAMIHVDQNMLAAFRDIKTRGELVRQPMRRASVQVFGLFRIDKLREHLHIMMEDRDMRHALLPRSRSSTPSDR